jgi:hypothetical protein
VVLATTRLDGRTYAIKKIRMAFSNPQINNKILREVATLSRLQHTHIVRYFQAWCEVGFGLGVLLEGESEESDDELDSDWLSSSGTHTHTRTRSDELVESRGVGAGGKLGSPHCACPTATKRLRIVTLRDFGCGIAHAPVSRRPPISLYAMVPRTGGYTCDASVWGLSIVQGPFSVAPCRTITLRFATFPPLYAWATRDETTVNALGRSRAAQQLKPNAE